VFEALSILYLLGAAQGLFLAVSLLTSKYGNRPANRILALYLLVFVASLADYALDMSGVTYTHPWLRTLLWPKEFLYGVLLFLYCREMTHPGLPLRPVQPWLLWTPPFLHACATWPLLWLPPEEQVAILLNEPGLDGMAEIWRILLGDAELYLTIAHLSLLLLICLRMVRAHREHILERFSSVEKVSLDWLRNVLIGTFVVYLIWLAEEFFSEDLLVGTEWLDIALAVSMVLLIYSLGFLGLRQPLIFAGQRGPEAEHGAPPAGNDEESELLPSGPSEAEVKYARSALSPELARALIEDLRALMARDTPYLEDGLSLADLATRMGVSTNYLSQAINQEAGENFFDFVNGYRIRHTLDRLANTDDPIVDIATDAGFNSRSAFYTAFRKHQGTTPGTWRRSGRTATA